MSGIIQQVDIDVQLETGTGELPFSPGMSVVDAEIERVFAASGSTAKIEVIFDDYLGAADEIFLRRMVDQGPVQTANRTNRPDYVDDMEDHFYGLGPQARREQELTMTVDVAVTNMGDDSIRTTDEDNTRLFTGTVIKVEQSDDRIVTFHALDRRHELNRNVVSLDTTEEPKPSSTIIRHILGEELGFTEGEDFIVDLGPNEEKIADSWGGNRSNETVFGVLRDITRTNGVPMHIDRENTIIIKQWPSHKYFYPETMAPIINWESGDDQTSNDVLVESPYDESGIGMYSPISGKLNSSQLEKGDDRNPMMPSSHFKENNVYSRRALQNVRTWERISNELTKDSGVIEVVGDPRVEAYDEFVINDGAINGFAPISSGQYTSKRAIHTINASDGYTTKIHLGRDPEELFREFTNTKTREELMEERLGQNKGILHDISDLAGRTTALGGINN